MTLGELFDKSAVTVVGHMAASGDKRLKFKASGLDFDLDTLNQTRNAIFSNIAKARGRGDQS